MTALVEAYCSDWRSTGLYASYFAIRVPNETARYHLVFLTHAERGLECWTKMQRRIDPVLGRGASPASIDAPTLFDGIAITSTMVEILRGYAGQEKTWQQMRIDAMQAGQSDRLLRAGLQELRMTGLAFRVEPLEATTPWPEGCTVRFYSEADLRDADQAEFN
ncbi:hypothetical protein GCM10009687_54700 [Asanoa iriomotensis]|uniref:Uncharacterized protein n=2 Tax=Asanoa iriomotensis TaxID=234613 RepID=A0ABQ4C5I8_9ACTN|nr:hypothetical protein Air01nite_41450 [Asanoa iriomotensis]